MLGSRRLRPRDDNIWPGFVDALGTLLLVILFLLMVFIMAQFFLGEALSGRDQALKQLQGRMAEVSDLLALEQRTNKELSESVSQLTDQLQVSIKARDELSSQYASLKERADADRDTVSAQKTRLATLDDQVSALEALKSDLESQISKTAASLDEQGKALLTEKELSESARAKLALANSQLAKVKEQLARLNTALEVSERKNEEQGVQIMALGKRLNAALATKVNELARYRSEFFGRLRKLLGGRGDVRVVGDRFVFQSEVLFASGDASLNPIGQTQLKTLAKSLKKVASTIPSDIDWILRVDGHTDSVPINNLKYPSNLELSAARAISVVKYLRTQGVPPNRLAATGFGEYWPLDTRGDEIARRRNRRIELKLTQR